MISSGAAGKQFPRPQPAAARPSTYRGERWVRPACLAERLSCVPPGVNVSYEHGLRVDLILSVHYSRRKGVIS